MTRTALAGEDRRVIIPITGGGFSFETKCLLNSFAGNMRLFYLKTEFGGVPGEDGIPLGESYPIPSFSSVTRRSVVGDLKTFLRTFLRTIAVIRTEQIDAAIVVGCSHAVPMILAARLLARKTIFIETITRVDQLSNTGKIIYYLRLADQFIVQWPAVGAKYPRARVGTVL
jgi:UDP-N-acetylglucosamine:LPS N-acetylglucosamine transferase